MLEPTVQFDVTSGLASGPNARFNNMPTTPLLTLGMDPPESWLVESVEAAYDLDNIYLEEVRGQGQSDDLENCLACVMKFFEITLVD